MAKIGIILSGAASKGAYEYGFLKAVDEFFQKDEIKCVSSASIGMLAAQTYGIGAPYEFERIWKMIDPKKHGRLFLSYGGPGPIRDEICKVFKENNKPF
jgi:predicted acylesterase/phospholipase RssA